MHNINNASKKVEKAPLIFATAASQNLPAEVKAAQAGDAIEYLGCTGPDDLLAGFMDWPSLAFLDLFIAKRMPLDDLNSKISRFGHR